MIFIIWTKTSGFTGKTHHHKIAIMSSSKIFEINENGKERLMIPVSSGHRYNVTSGIFYAIKHSRIVQIFRIFHKSWHVTQP